MLIRYIVICVQYYYYIIIIMNLTSLMTMHYMIQNSYSKTISLFINAINDLYSNDMEMHLDTSADSGTKIILVVRNSNIQAL